MDFAIDVLPTPGGRAQNRRSDIFRQVFLQLNSKTALLYLFGPVVLFVSKIRSTFRKSKRSFVDLFHGGSKTISRWFRITAPSGEPDGSFTNLSVSLSAFLLFLCLASLPLIFFYIPQPPRAPSLIPELVCDNLQLLSQVVLALILVNL